MCSKLQIEMSHNQLSGRHIEIPTPEFLMILFVWNYLIILNEWLKCTPRPENCIQYHQCYCLIRNSQMSHLAHLPLTLKSPPSHTDHHPYFLPIFPIFYHNFPFRNTLISIFGNVIWTLKKSPPPPNIIPIFFYLTWSHLPYLEMVSGSWKQYDHTALGKHLQTNKQRYQ